MRLISQDGMIDVPYEISALSIGFGEPDRKYNIYIRSKLFDEKPCVFATYSTKDKVLTVVEMLRKQFLDYCCNYHSQSGVFYFPKDEEVEINNGLE